MWTAWFDKFKTVTSNVWLLKLKWQINISQTMQYFIYQYKIIVQMYVF